MNRLYYGDNLQVMRDCVSDDSIDVTYLDPVLHHLGNH